MGGVSSRGPAVDVFSLAVISDDEAAFEGDGGSARGRTGYGLAETDGTLTAMKMTTRDMYIHNERIVPALLDVEYLQAHGENECSGLHGSSTPTTDVQFIAHAATGGIVVIYDVHVIKLQRKQKTENEKHINERQWDAANLLDTKANGCKILEREHQRATAHSQDHTAIRTDLVRIRRTHQR